VLDSLNTKKNGFFPEWAARRRGGNDLEEKRKFDSVWLELRVASTGSKLNFLTDTRSIHRRIFRDVAPPDFDVYAGHYRGEDYPPLKFRTAVVRYRRPYVGVKPLVRFIEPEDVSNEIDFLKSKIVSLHDTKLDVVPYFAESVSIFRRFSSIHPYLNGNGRISRLMLALLADMKGIHVSSDWHFHKRPYDNFIGFCFQQYPTNPHLLIAYLSRWFS
jgi:fido (protein-threonine AMPylation protein)